MAGHVAFTVTQPNASDGGQQSVSHKVQYEEIDTNTTVFIISTNSAYNYSFIKMPPTHTHTDFHDMMQCGVRLGLTRKILH